MKKCKICVAIKDESEFYSNKNMNDGLQSYCKICTSKRAISDRRNRKLTMIGKAKYAVYEKKRAEKYDALYPEKTIAKTRAAKLDVIPGTIKHHWSYNKEYWMDIIYLTRSEHNTAHKHMIYDQERMMFRRLDGTLLDTKEEHLAYIKTLLK